MFVLLCLAYISMFPGFIHVIACIRISCLFVAEFHGSISRVYISFIHSSGEGHLGCFCLWGIVNNVAINTGVQIPESLLSVLWGICLGIKLLDRMIILGLTFRGATKLFSAAAVHSMLQRIFKKILNLGDFPGGPVLESLCASAGDMGSIPGPGRSHMPMSHSH